MKVRISPERAKQLAREVRKIYREALRETRAMAERLDAASARKAKRRRCNER